MGDALARLAGSMGEDATSLVAQVSARWLSAARRWYRRRRERGSRQVWRWPSGTAGPLAGR